MGLGRGPSGRGLTFVNPSALAPTQDLRLRALLLRSPFGVRGVPTEYLFLEALKDGLPWTNKWGARIVPGCAWRSRSNVGKNHL